MFCVMLIRISGTKIFSTFRSWKACWVQLSSSEAFWWLGELRLACSRGSARCSSWLYLTVLPVLGGWLLKLFTTSRSLVRLQFRRTRPKLRSVESAREPSRELAACATACSGGPLGPHLLPPSPTTCHSERSRPKLFPPLSLLCKGRGGGRIFSELPPPMLPTHF